jgi:nicotinamide mononucleotide transporter
MNIVMGQWVLLVLKLGYFTNTTYGYIKWTKYIKVKESNKSVTYINLKKATA